MEWKPSRLFIDRRASGDPLVRRIAGNLPGAVMILTDTPGPWAEEGGPGPSDLVIFYQEGPFVRDFVIPEGAPPCGEKYIGVLAGCPFRCTYCYITPRLLHRARSLMACTGIMKSEVAAAARSGPFRLTTGEMADSLLLDRVTGLTAELLPLFEGTESIFELRTKTSSIGHLPGISKEAPVDPALARRHLAITWSLAPDGAAGAEERGAPPVQERIEALSVAASAGLATGIRLDPIIPWYWDRLEYASLLERVRDAVGDAPPPRVELGVLRFPAGLVDHIRRTRPSSPILRGEFVLCPDGKTRLYRPQRVGIYREAVRIVSKVLPGAPVELSMEDATVWEDAGIEPPVIPRGGL